MVLLDIVLNAIAQIKISDGVVITVTEKARNIDDFIMFVFIKCDEIITINAVSDVFFFDQCQTCCKHICGF